MVDFVLASGSPRRQQLLTTLGFNFRVVVPDVDESVEPAEPADRYVARVAAMKASTSDGAVVLAADTTVVLDGAVVGKPTDTQDAVAILQRLAGRTHTVFTGVCVTGPEGTLSQVVRSDVTMGPLNRQQIESYIRSGEPMDKAGAYALQGIGMAFVDRVEGSVTNVIGLPVDVARRLLSQQGVEPGYV